MSNEAQRARSALEAGDLATALKAALEAWRVAHHPSIGRAIARIESRVEYLPIKLAADEFQIQWLRRARSSDSEQSTGWLAATLQTRVPTLGYYDVSWRERRRRRHEPFVNRLASLVNRLPDPRLADATMAVIVAAKLPDSQVYNSAFKALLRHCDHNHVIALQELQKQPCGSNYQARKIIAAALPKAITRLSKVAPTGTADSVWDQLLPEPKRSEGAARSAEEILAMVYADPYDDELRHVCADRLQELGDPRGEFIALQLLDKPSKEAKRRIRDLKDDHADEWLGPILSLALKAVQFREGFPVHATLAAVYELDDAEWDEALEDPRLATFESIKRGKAPIWLHQRFRDALEAFDEEE